MWIRTLIGKIKSLKHVKNKAILTNKNSNSKHSYLTVSKLNYKRVDKKKFKRR